MPDDRTDAPAAPPPPPWPDSEWYQQPVDYDEFAGAEPVSGGSCLFIVLVAAVILGLAVWTVVDGIAEIWRALS